MVRCACSLEAVIRTSWTNRNPGRHFYGFPTLTQREAQQANELSNLTRQRQLLASTREDLERIQKAVLIKVIELKRELRLQDYKISQVYDNATDADII
ncbi:hypothetical protein Tco_1318128 [Tanacetum coccineum]